MMALSLDDYLAGRGIPDELREEALRATQDKIKTYNLMQARKSRDVTQAELSRDMGVSQKRISDIENGRLDLLKVDTLRRYIAALGGTLEISAHLPSGTVRLI
ncbi:helix-turn-helix domain-containing protein [Olsenella sp. SW781]|nr:helix-turn-helix domain-containing protein [Olsenella sp. SW781]